MTVTFSPSGNMPSADDSSSQASIIGASHDMSMPQNQFPRWSSATPDRVFPIRSVISVSPRSDGPSSPGYTTQNPFYEQNLDNMQESSETSQTGGASAELFDDLSAQAHDVAFEEHIPSSPVARSGPKHLRHLALETVSGHHSSDETSFTSSTDGGVSLSRQEPRRSITRDWEDEGLLTSRFQHVETEDGHVVVTGNSEPYQSCEDEPIHIPGAIQSFGVLFALRQESDGKLVVRVVSENSEELIGYTPKQLFELNSFTDILSDEQQENLLDHIDFVRDDDCDPRTHGPEVFILTIADPAGEARKFWCAIHVPENQKDLIVCELELEDDHIHPLNVSGQTTPKEPSDTLGQHPTPEEFASSTVNVNRPIRVLRSARRRRGEATAMKVFNILSQIEEQLTKAPTLDVLLNTGIGLVKELTGFHRVMIYQFDSSWNGVVVAELLDPKASKDLYKGLHFPASDIPRQARELYKINKVRLLYDREMKTARLVCRTMKDLETPLDMTHAYLRAISPIHLQYLANMDVRASMSISINVFNELWGLITCHSYGSQGMRVPFPIRKICRLLGDTMARNIERLSYTTRLQARKLINTVPTGTNPSGYIIASSEDLLKLFGADYGALSIRDETKILGRLSHSDEVLALIEYLKLRQLSTVVASHDVGHDFPDLQYPPGFKHVCGLLYVPLSAKGSDFIVFFRRGQLTEIKWAGNPYEKESGIGTLRPRRSFQTWRETVRTQSRAWSETDVETAAVLCLVYGKFIEVWRQKEAALQNTQLTKLLLANSAHEVRTPLNAIVNYLEIALEGSLDSETRDNLARSYSASKSLIYVINDLLDLTNTEKGKRLMKDEVFDLPMTLKEAADMFDGEVKRKEIQYYVRTHPGIPRLVLGDQRRVRQVIMNIISNAVQHTTAGAVHVDMRRAPGQPEQSNSVDIEIAVEDTGTGMSRETMDALFRDLEQVSTEDENYYYEHDGEVVGQQKRVLGLGLALVARIVRNMQGQLSVKSEQGKGSRFKMTLRFPLPDQRQLSSGLLETIPSGVANIPESSPEVFLVDRNMSQLDIPSPTSAEIDARRKRRDSSQSNRSQADRFINAIRQPAMSVRDESPSGRARTGSPLNSLTEPLAKAASHPEGVQKIPAGSSIVAQRNIRNSDDLQHVKPLGSPRVPGQQTVTDSGVPLSGLRIPPLDIGRPQSPTDRQRPNAAAKTTDKQQTGSKSSGHGESSKPEPDSSLYVLVAEDDPINSKIVQKRLERSGHKVQLTVNGKECIQAYRANPQLYDVVLMDLQVKLTHPRKQYCNIS